MNITRDEILERWDDLSDALREALYDDVLENAVIQLIEKQTITEDHYWDIQDALKAVLFGFIRPKDSYEFLQERLKDAKKALAAYQLFDEYVFKKYSSEIAQAYEFFNTKFAHAQEPITQEKVDLKAKVEPEAINLKEVAAPKNNEPAVIFDPTPKITPARPIQQPIAAPVTSAPIPPRPTGFSAPSEPSTPLDIRPSNPPSSSQSFTPIPRPQPTPFIQNQPVQNFSNFIRQSPPATQSILSRSSVQNAPGVFSPSPSALPPQFSNASQPQQTGSFSQSHQSIPSSPSQNQSPVFDTPFIIHQKEMINPVAQSSPKEYKQMSYGNFMGSLRTPMSQANPQQERKNVARAHVEIPVFMDPVSSNAPEKNVPLNVKKYDNAPQKTINYGEEAH